MTMYRPTPILERIEAWYEYATSQGYNLKRILIHPDDARKTPPSYRGLPVECLGERKCQ